MNYDNIKQDDFKNILQLAHRDINSHIRSSQKVAQAKELTDILSEIKRVALSIKDKKNFPAMRQDIYNSYINLISEALTIQNESRTEAGLAILKSKGSLFSRSHRGSSTYTDDILEEQFVSILAALDKIGQKGKRNKTYFVQLSGKSSGNTAAAIVKKQSLDQTHTLIRQGLENYTKEAIKEGVAENRSMKSDVYRIQAQMQYNLPQRLQRLHELTSGKSFSLKNYSSFKQVIDNKVIYKSNSDIKVHFGKSDLYKAITGTLSLILNPQDSHSFLYRGMQILAGNTKPPDTATPDEVALHFAHSRLIYELTGAGLIAKDTGRNDYVDFLIFNDPASERILVRDTSSLILQQIESGVKTNLINGQVEIRASHLFMVPRQNY